MKGQIVKKTTMDNRKVSGKRVHRQEHHRTYKHVRGLITDLGRPFSLGQLRPSLFVFYGIRPVAEVRYRDTCANLTLLPMQAERLTQLRRRPLQKLSVLFRVRLGTGEMESEPPSFLFSSVRWMKPASENQEQSHREGVIPHAWTC